MTGVCITVLRTAGSAPRGAGTQMMVWAERTEGTIGGGALEWQAMATARAMLASGDALREETVPLGPSLGQCCGGSVTLRWEMDETMADAPGAPIWVYGAGHVGRALVNVLAPLPQMAVTWIDTSVERFPAILPVDVTQLVAADPARVVVHAPADATHLVLTYSHALDLAICHAVLSRDFDHAGLIGSATKRARFRKRLAELGHPPEQIGRIACPIGDPQFGKHPQQIAIGVAAALLGRADHAVGEKAG